MSIGAVTLSLESSHGFVSAEYISATQSRFDADHFQSVLQSPQRLTEQREYDDPMVWILEDLMDELDQKRLFRSVFPHDLQQHAAMRLRGDIRFKLGNDAINVLLEFIEDRREYRDPFVPQCDLSLLLLLQIVTVFGPQRVDAISGSFQMSNHSTAIPLVQIQQRPHRMSFESLVSAGRLSQTPRPLARSV